GRQKGGRHGGPPSPGETTGGCFLGPALAPHSPLIIREPHPQGTHVMRREDPETRLAAEGATLWEPGAEARARATLTRYMAWLGSARGLSFDSYEALWRWSVTDLEEFWGTIWEFCGIKARRPYGRVLPERRVFDAKWCPGAELNYAEHALARRDGHPAVVSKSEDRPPVTLTYAELAQQVAAVAAALRGLGVRRGDRVVAY